jgi:hypothetical protein
LHGQYLEDSAILFPLKYNNTYFQKNLNTKADSSNKQLISPQQLLHNRKNVFLLRHPGRVLGHRYDLIFDHGEVTLTDLFG